MSFGIPKTCDIKDCRKRDLRRVSFRNGDYSWVCETHELLLWRTGKIPLNRNKLEPEEEETR